MVIRKARFFILCIAQENVNDNGRELSQMKLNDKRITQMKLKREDVINETDAITNSKLR